MFFKFLLDNKLNKVLPYIYMTKTPPNKDLFLKKQKTLKITEITVIDRVLNYIIKY